MNDTNFEHLEWAIKRRHDNQMITLKILKLFEEYPNNWKTSSLAGAAQNLAGVAFSLWRAAFLAEKTGSREAVFNDCKVFLKKVIEDNSIGYPNDKASREWTFNYYTRSARFMLERLHYAFPELTTKYENATRSAKARWDYCHELLCKAAEGFERELHGRAERAKSKKIRSAAKVKQRANRKIVRAMTRAKQQ